MFVARNNFTVLLKIFDKVSLTNNYQFWCMMDRIYAKLNLSLFIWLFSMVKSSFPDVWPIKFKIFRLLQNWIDSIFTLNISLIKLGFFGYFKVFTQNILTLKLSPSYFQFFKHKVSSVSQNQRAFFGSREYPLNRGVTIIPINVTLNLFRLKA